MRIKEKYTRDIILLYFFFEIIKTFLLKNILLYIINKSKVYVAPIFCIMEIHNDKINLLLIFSVFMLKPVVVALLVA